MHFWNVGSLAQRLKNNLVSEREKFQYLFATLFYLGAGIWGSHFLPVVYRFVIRGINWHIHGVYQDLPDIELFANYDFLVDAITAMIMITGLLLSFQANQQRDNKNFIERYICISWPTVARVGIFFLLIFSLFALTGTGFYAYKLLGIAGMRKKTAPEWLMYFMKIKGGGFMTGAAQLFQLKQLIKQLNRISQWLYLASCGLMPLYAVWCQLTIRRTIAWIGRQSSPAQAP